MSETTKLYIYLDQNKWIDLVRAYLGKPNGKKFAKTLQLAQTAVDQDRAIFPLSQAHIMETIKIGNLKQREDLINRMIPLSKGWVLASPSILVQEELSREIPRLYGKETVKGQPEAFGRGILFALGDPERLLSEMGISNPTWLKAVLDTPEAFSNFLTNAVTDRHFQQNWETFADQAEKGRALRKLHSKEVRRRAYVALLAHGLQGHLAKVLSQLGLRLQDFFALGTEQLLAFFDTVPTLHVEIELATERDEHWDKSIDKNDTLDISFLSQAIPYCDIVVTERFWVSLAKRKKLDKKYDTVMLNDLTELNEYL